jgi:HSP20 family protein
MSIRDLIPARDKPVRFNRRTDIAPMDAFHREIDRLFGRMFDDFGLPSPWRNEPASWDAGWPAINMAEDKNEIVITAELPGVNEKDVSIELAGETLTLRGETETEKEEKGRRWTRIERSTGSFHRTIELPCGVREEGAKASFKRGLLTIHLPKAEPDEAKNRVIPIE